jgi:hypothetical protein
MFVREMVIGQKFGRLTLISLMPNKRYRTFFCKCDCGNTLVIRGDSILRSKLPSCGCYFKEIMRELQHRSHITHNKTNTRIYKEWQNMKKRCLYPNFEHYDRYGGRGISICPEWKEHFESFYKWAIANGYNDTLTLDRVNNDGNYEPANCRWATRTEQVNNRCDTVFINYENNRETLASLSKILGLTYSNVKTKYYRGKLTGYLEAL